MRFKDIKLFRKTPAVKVFEVVDKILLHHGQALTDEQKFRLKADALVFKHTLLYQLLMSKIPDEMQEEIVENCKNDDDMLYYRAILADRRIMEKEIDAWANAKIPPPILVQKPPIDTPKN